MSDNENQESQENANAEQNQEQSTSENQEQQQGNDNPNADPDWEPAKTGAVLDEENDGRLKENRVEGRTKGTTEHSAKAPKVNDESSEGSVNSEDRPAQDIYAERHGNGNQNDG